MKKEKRYLNLIFGRTGIIILLILLQAIYFFKTFTVIGQYIYFFIGGSSLISFFMVIYLMNNNQNPMVKLSFTILVLIAPIFTTMLYLFIKLDLGNRVIRRKLKRIIKKTKNILKQDKKVLEEINQKNKGLYNLVRYINRISKNNIHKGYNLEFFKVGEEKFEKMLKDLKNAKDFIFLEYFIISKGIMWDSILEILKEKAKEGVEVRIMYDGSCAFSYLPYSYPKELESYGIKAKMFSPIKPFISTHYNNRDHRKILIIDGKIGYTGGINLGDEYINKVVKFGHWKDSSIRFEGPAVDELTIMFLQMYNIGEKIEEDYKKYLNKYKVSDIEDGYIIPYGDLPIDDYLLAKGIYLDLINNAKDYVYITTPYLVLDNEMVEALKLAALKGVDVRIILPHIPDKKIPFAIAHSHYFELVSSGIKIYEYESGFIHSKMFLVDDEISIIGTINMDYRSLYHNFECAVLIYGSKVLKDVKEDILYTIEKSIFVDFKYIKNDKLSNKILGRLLKIIAPLI